MRDLTHEREYIEKIQSKAYKSNKVYVYNEVALEITRRCPLSCDHCLKGEQQQKGMSREVMEAFFEHTMGIRTLSLASGETAFAVNKIKILNEVLRKYKPTVEHIHIYTNGIKITDEYIKQLKLLQQYVVEYGAHHNENKFDMRSGVLRGTAGSERFPLVITLSNDNYHKKARKVYFEKQFTENTKNPENQEKFIAGIEKLIQNFPVSISEGNLMFNIGKARQLDGIKKYNMPIENIAVWQASRFGVEIVHTYPHMGVYYDGSLGEVRCSYDEQDANGVKLDSSKTMYERLLMVPNTIEISGDVKKFKKWIIKQQLTEQYNLANPFNYTKKAEQIER